MARIRRQLAKWVARSRLEREDRDGALLGAGSLVLLVLIDLCYHHRVNLSGSLVVAPVIAAALASPAIVAGVGVLSAVASVALAQYDSSLRGWVVKLGVVSVGTLAGVLTARHRRSIQARALRLKSVAEAAESALLRPLPSRVGPASMAGWHVAARMEARVGGDFYEAVGYGTRARWIIGDARGHGVEAIRLGAAAVGAFREAASRLEHLQDVAARVDESLNGFLGEEDFVTALFGELGHDGVLRVINCGHPLPFLLDRSGSPVVSLGATRPLGIEPDLTPQAIHLDPGDALCFHTDGLVEARTTTGRDLDPALLGTGLGDKSADDAAEAVRERLQSAVGGVRFQDDVSVLVVKYLPLTEINRPRLHAQEPPEPAAGTGPA